MIDGLALFHECLNHREPLVDENYCYDQLIISPKAEDVKTEVMNVWQRVQDRITCAKVSLQDGDNLAYIQHLQKLDDELMGGEHANYLEFTSFFPVMDVSFSMYKKLKYQERIEFLGKLLKAFIEKRHSVYSSHGYSPSTIQVRKDFEKHKSQGNFGNKKIERMLITCEYVKAYLKDEPYAYCSVDKEMGKKSLRKLVYDGATWYDEWSSKREGKTADMLFRNDNGYFICEAKHVKEGGGGQDKQVNEIIAFIANQNHVDRKTDVFYVSFLDGVYFNKFINPSPRSQKVCQQKASIEDALSKGRQNYFVNTYGLRRLIEDK